MKYFLILFTIVFINSSRDVPAQVSQEWAKRLNSSGTNNDYALAMTYDAAGNVYVTGRGGNDYLTVKYSPEGTVLWQAVYNGPANDADNANAIAVDNAGNVYITGRSFGTGTETDFATIKYDAAGTQLWVQRYNGSNNSDDAGISVVIDAAGNVYAGGWASQGSSVDYTIVKYSSAGSQLWVRNYNNGSNDFLRAMVIDASGNIYATGVSRGASNDDYATVKYNSSGTLLWSARYNGSGVDDAKGLTVDQQGSVIVTGYATTAATGKDYTTVKYNNAGIQQWVKKYNRTGTTQDEAVGIVSDNTGNIYVTGFCAGSGTSTFDYVTVKYNTNGDQQWAKVFNSGLVGVDDKASSIDIDETGNIYVTGSTISSGTDTDYGTVKYSPAGDVLWSILYENIVSVDDNAVMVKADNNGNVYVTGNSSGFSGFDFLTVKYSQPIGITPISTEVPEGFSLGQNFPNPFNPVTNIGLRIARFGFVSLKVYDITGKEAAVLVNENLGAGTYNVDFDASQLASGTYFYRLVVGDNTNNGVSFTDVKKMILVK
ncbi:MAG TPA: SBBP repeat-containing protein [Ignavibacteria bacterium]|nr:SBBP repeat-containing protein [Ignavibacteria bacterium]HRF66300.1 SBBP repeat-containing protein [Ignavibacteria bacterium]HRJ05453.1 SBBP repeat-containing protein [Ignavibacteria bacterium]